MNDLQLTPNFKLSEFVRKGDSFTPEILANIKCLANRLQAVRDLVGESITISSGYRTPEHNREVGGASDSQHLLGTAADISIKGMTPKQTAKLLSNWSGGLGLYPAHVHVDIRPEKARWNG